MLISLPMSTYTDHAQFRNAVPRLDSDKFHELRPNYLTYKHRLYDLGLSIIFASVLLFGLGKKWFGIATTISSKKTIYTLIFVLPLLFSISYIAHIGRLMFRDEVPVWADSPGIPLSATPDIFFII